LALVQENELNFMPLFDYSEVPSLTAIHQSLEQVSEVFNKVPSDFIKITFSCFVTTLWVITPLMLLYMSTVPQYVAKMICVRNRCVQVRRRSLVSAHSHVTSLYATLSR